MVSVATIGFTKIGATAFFERLENAGIRKIIDVRLHNTSQLAGFAKADDLRFFLSRVLQAEYVHEPLLAPTDDMLSAFKKEKGDWQVYEQKFLDLMSRREIENRFSPETFEGACLLCSEAKPHHCHRRLVCDYLNRKWGGKLSVQHL